MEHEKKAQRWIHPAQPPLHLVIHSMPASPNWRTLRDMLLAGGNDAEDEITEAT